MFCHAVGEDLPWPDGSFDTITAATSLDHAIHLPDLLREIIRVLIPGGRLIIWIGFIEGAKPYDPELEPSAVDDYHLFHFDKAWLERLLAEQFELCVRFKVPEKNEWFYLYEIPHRRLSP
jgi:ubiquinone/menaquinone biosynthesis C-methylase UbiE